MTAAGAFVSHAAARTIPSGTIIRCSSSAAFKINKSSNGRRQAARSSAKALRQ